MIKTILSTAVVAMLVSGCVATGKDVVKEGAKDAKNAAVNSATASKDAAVNSAKETANSAVSSAQNTATDAVGSVTGQAQGAVEAAGAVQAPTMTDMAVDKAVEIADEHTDGKASMVKDMLAQ